MKESLVENPDITHPVTYHERTGHTLPGANNVISQQFKKLGEFARTHEMVINEHKTKVMLFNTGRKFDFEPQIETESGKILEVLVLEPSVNKLALISINLVGSLEVKALAMKVRDPGSNPGQPPLLK